MGTKARKVAALLAVVAGTLMLSTSASAEETLKHKGKVKGQKKAKVSLTVTKSDDGLLAGVSGFQVKNLKLKCRHGSVREDYRIGGFMTLSGDNLARKGKFQFTEDTPTRDSELRGTVKNGGRKTNGKLSVNGLFHTPGGLERCVSTVKFKTKLKKPKNR